MHEVVSDRNCASKISGRSLKTAPNPPEERTLKLVQSHRPQATDLTTFSFDDFSIRHLNLNLTNNTAVTYLPDISLLLEFGILEVWFWGFGEDNA